MSAQITKIIPFATDWSIKSIKLVHSDWRRVQWSNQSDALHKVTDAHRSDNQKQALNRCVTWTRIAWTEASYMLIDWPNTSYILIRWPDTIRSYHWLTESSFSHAQISDLKSQISDLRWKIGIGKLSAAPLMLRQHLGPWIVVIECARVNAVGWGSQENLLQQRLVHETVYLILFRVSCGRMLCSRQWFTARDKGKMHGVIVQCTT